jgi:hypothetical protein
MPTSTTAARPSTTISAVAYPLVPVEVSEQTLPRTGSNSAGGLLRLADAGFVLGVALIAVTSLVPRRVGRQKISQQD